MNTQVKVTMDSLESRTMYSATPAVVGYLPDYQVEKVQNADTGKLDKIDWNSLTEINYFSIVPNADGTLPTQTSSGGSMAQLDEVVTEAHQHGVKVNIVIGGAGLDTSLFNISNDWTKWETFSDSLNSFTSNHNLDGVDLDLEKAHPAEYQINNYGDLIANLKSNLNGNLQLSAAVYATKLSIATDEDPTGESYSNMQWQLNNVAIANLDRIGVMDYDLNYNDHANLNDSEYAMNQWAKQVGSDNTGKLLFGVPFYGKAGTSWNNNDSVSYSDLADKYLKSHSTLPTNDIINAKFSGKLGGTKQDWYYNGQDTVTKKTQFAINNGYAGVMAWDLGQDHVAGTDNTTGQTDHLSLLTTIGNTVRANGYTFSQAHIGGEQLTTPSIASDILA